MIVRTPDGRTFRPGDVASVAADQHESESEALARIAADRRRGRSWATPGVPPTPRSTR